MPKKNTKMKLTKAFFALAITSSIPATASAIENMNIEYSYSGDLITMINPTYWDYDYNTVQITTPNTNLRLTKEEFNELLNTNAKEIIINDGASTITYTKQDLIEKAQIADDNYNPNNEIIKKVVLNGGVTLLIITGTALCIYTERKQKKLTK